MLQIVVDARELLVTEEVWDGEFVSNAAYGLDELGEKHLGVSLTRELVGLGKLRKVPKSEDVGPPDIGGKDASLLNKRQEI